MYGKIETDKIPYDLVSIPSIGDGSCFFHSVLRAFHRSYIESTRRQQKMLVRDLRQALALVLGETDPDSGLTYYEKLSRGKLGEISKELKQYTLENFVDYLDSDAWADMSVLELISDQLCLDIYIISSDTGDIYNTGDYELYYKNRKSIILYNISNVHFETVGLYVDGEVKTLFDPGSSLIRFLNERYRIISL